MALMMVVLGQESSLRNILFNNAVSASAQCSLCPLDLVDGSSTSKSQLSTFDEVAAGKSWGDAGIFFFT